MASSPRATGPVRAAAGPSSATLSRRPGEVEVGLERHARRRRDPLDLAEQRRRGGSRRCTRRRGSGPGGPRRRANERAVERGDHLVGQRIAVGRDPEPAPAQARGAPARVGQRHQRVEHGPAGVAGEHVEPERPGQVGDHRVAAGRDRRPRPRPTAASGVAITSRSTPAAPRAEVVAAAERRRDVPARPRRARAASDPPARPGPTMRTRGHGTCRSSGPTARTWPSAAPAGRGRRGRGPGRRSGASTKRRRHIRGWGTWRSGSSTLDAVDPEHVDVERARPPAHRAHPSAAASSRWHTPSSSRGVEVGVELDDQVQVRRPASGPPTGSVSYTGDTADRRRSSVVDGARRRSRARSPRFDPRPRKARVTAAPGARSG